MSSGEQSTREQILIAAARLLHERGAEHVRMADVGHAAGVSRQAVYLHFGSRAGLLVALVGWVDEAEGLGEQIAHVMSAPDSVAALERLVELHADFTPRILPVVEAIDAVRGQDAAAQAAWQDRLDHRLAGCRTLVGWLRREERLSDEWTEDRAAEMLWSLTSLHTWRDLVIARGWSREEYVYWLKRMLHRLFVRGPPGRRGPE